MAMVIVGIVLTFIFGIKSLVLGKEILVRYDYTQMLKKKAE